MLRYKLLLLILITHARMHVGMETHETVQRMVMVRTTGSDLQPAATGFIYKKENDGKEKVVEMGETEVMDQLAKIYEQPKAFAAPIPVVAGPFYGKEEDVLKAASDNKERVIPVQEAQEEIDGIADEDYRNIFKEYPDNNGKYSFSDYLRRLENFNHDDKDYKRYKINNGDGNDDAINYRTGKFETYSTGATSNIDDDINSFEKHYDSTKKDSQAEKDEAVNGFQNSHLINTKDGNEFYDDDTLESVFNKYSNGDEEDGSNFGKYGENISYGSDYYGDNSERSYEGAEDPSNEREHSGEESSDGISQFGTNSGFVDGKSYKFEVKH